MKKTVALGVLMALALNATSVFAAANQVNVNVDPGTTVNVNVQKTQPLSDVMNWEKPEDATVTAEGAGVPGKFTGAKGRLMARRAAIVDCYRNLAEQIQGVQVDGDTTMKDMEIASDIVKTKVSALIKGAKIIREQELPDGSYVVTMSLPMFGGTESLAAAVMPEVMKDTPQAEPPAMVTPKNTAMPKEEFKEVQKEVKTAGYTGIVIDAGGKGLESTMAPQIIDTNGRVVYGKENIDIDFAVSHGLVEYSSNLQQASNGSSRAGNNPLIIKATGVKGGTNSVNPVNVVVSPEDADKILLAAQNNANVFKSGAVVFVK